MKKSEELRRVTLAMGAIAFFMFTLIVHSVFGVKTIAVAAAKETISRIPASLGIAAEPKVLKRPTTARLDVSCASLSDATEWQVQSTQVQVHFIDCDKQSPQELINLRNGFQATLFNGPMGSMSDLVTLEEGENEVHLRLEKAPAPFSLKIKVNL